MFENLIISDFYYYLLTALFGGVVFAYAIKKLLSVYYLNNSQDNYNNFESFTKSEEILKNNNIYSNGKTLKQKDSKNNKSINNNESEESEVNEDIITEDCSKSLESQPLSSDSNNISDVESNDKTTEEDEGYKTEVIEVITKTEVKLSPQLSESEVKRESNLAAIILTDDNRKDWFEIVCVTSGSDVIEARNLKPEFVVVDCRAPVLARRCLIKYLYHKLNELVKHKVNEENSIFTAIPASNRFELKKNYKLNLFLSEPPDDCESKTKRINGPKNGPKNGTKTKGNQLVWLKSTTDKISVWNQVGVQGSLLSHFIDAIFINNVIIPVEFNQKSFHQHFILNYTKEPKLQKCDNSLIEDIIEQINRVRVNYFENVATNWVKTEDSLEIIDCKTGKAITDVTNECTSDGLSISRLSKHELNKCFRDFLTNYEYNLRPHQSLPMTYRKWKESAPNYRIQKQLLKVRYAVAGRQWLCLPSDLDMFL